LFLERHQLEGVPYYDTAGAARMLATSGGEHLGVIASELCSHMYRLSVVMDGIADGEGNMTRFLVIARQKGDEAGDKCSLIFTTRDRSGALMNVLRCFADARINLTRIESMPLAGPEARYRFFVDFHGSDEEASVAETFMKVQTLVDGFRLIGCYPRAR
jgi:prephenate dehydratase